MTPSHDGSRTPLHGGAWDPSSANTPARSEAEFDYSLDVPTPSPVGVSYRVSSVARLFKQIQYVNFIVQFCCILTGCSFLFSGLWHAQPRYSWRVHCSLYPRHTGRYLWLRTHLLPVRGLPLTSWICEPCHSRQRQPQSHLACVSPPHPGG
jgi:hypothetical protein